MLIRWTDQDLSRIVSDLQQRHRRRDARAAVWRALIYGRSEFDPTKTGTAVVPPFDKSKLILKYMTRDLMDGIGKMVAKALENGPKVQVNRIVAIGKEPSQRATDQAGTLERAVMGMYHADDGDEKRQPLKWSQVVAGIGWMLDIERAAGWGLPERIFYDDLTDEEAASLSAVKINESRYAERADLWERRKSDASKARAERADSIFLLDPIAYDKVYCDWDAEGLKVALVSEDVPTLKFGPDSSYLDGTSYAGRGLIQDKGGKILGGVSRGQHVTSTGGDSWGGDNPSQYFTLHRIFSRDEIYFYVAGQGTAQGGAVLYETEHDYGEVPLYDAAFLRTDSERPEERYVSPVEAALGVAPYINQLTTQLSNLTALKGTPRFAIELPSGQFVFDEVTKEMKTWASEDLLFADASNTPYVENGGKAISLNNLLGDDGSLFQLLEFWTARMDRLMLPPAATGNAGDSGPAWGKLLMQQASSETLRPLAFGEARMWERIFRKRLRTIRRRGEPVGIISVPGQRRDQRGMTYYIELDPSLITDNITVQIEPSSMQEQIIRKQVGAELLQQRRITPRMYQEEYAGEDDPDAVLFELDATTMEDMVFADIVPMVKQMIEGRMASILAPVSPNVAQQAATELTPPQQPGMAEAAGVRSPGVGMSATMPSLPPLQGQQAMPAGAPVQAGG